MAIKTIEQLKRWFGKGCYPTESQFGDLIDSFRHKSTQIQLTEVLGLAQELNRKYDSKQGALLLAQVQALSDRHNQLAGELENQLAAIGYSKENFAEILDIVEKYAELSRAVDNIDDYIIPQEIQPQIDYNRYFIERINDSVGSCTRTVTDAYGTVTVPGIAPLNEAGLIEARFLPSFVDDAMDFDGWAPDIDDLQNWFAGDAGSSETRLLFWRSEGTFVLEVTPVSSTGKPQTPVYYAGWEKTEDQKLCLGRAGATGYYPLKTKTYYCPATNKSYRWTGGSLAPTGSDLDLGDGANMAFPGDRGKALEEQKADRAELSPVLMRDPAEELEAAEPDFLSLMLRKNEQALTEEERRQVMENLGRPDRAGLLEHAKTVFNIRVQQSGASWFSAGLVRDAATGLWQFDAVHDLSDEDVITALLFWPMMRGRTYTRCFQRSPLRFAVLHNDADADPQVGVDSGSWLFAGSDVEEVVMSGGPGLLCAVGEKMFEYAAKLRVIRGFIPCYNIVPSFKGCTALEEVALVSVRKDISLPDSPNLSLNSITRMVDNGSSGVAITLHADAFARLTDEILAAAAAKNITLTTP